MSTTQYNLIRKCVLRIEQTLELYAVTGQKVDPKINCIPCNLIRKTCWFCLKFYISELLKRINRNRQNTTRRQFYHLLKYITENMKFPTQ